LLRPSFSLSDEGTRAELQQLVIEQRFTGLERNRHAHAIDLREHVVDHVGAGVDIHRTIERVGRGAGAVGIPERSECVVTIDRPPEITGIQPALGVGFEHAVGVLERIRLIGISREMAERTRSLDRER
jgi:hypothetical protein